MPSSDRLHRLLIACAALSIGSNVTLAQTDELCLQRQAGNRLFAPVVRVLSLNVSHGRGTAWNQLFVRKKRHYDNLDLIARLIRDSGADVAALQEADAPSRWSGRFDHVHYLLEQSGLSCSVHGRHAENWLYSYGTAILQRVHPTDASERTFQPSPPTTDKGFVSSEFNWIVAERQLLLTVVSVHLDFSRKSVRDAQVAEMVEALSVVEGPLVVMGDLNSEWAEQRSHVRALVDGLGLIAYEPESAALGTYKSSDGKRLDWILISSHLEFVDYEVLPDIVSDHRAVYAEIGYRRE